jgi:hypothetical protein
MEKQFNEMVMEYNRRREKGLSADYCQRVWKKIVEMYDPSADWARYYNIRHKEKTMDKETIMAYYQAPIYTIYKQKMEWLVRNARRLGGEVTPAAWKREADSFLKSFNPNAGECDKKMMYAWADHLKKTI